MSKAASVSEMKRRDSSPFVRFAQSCVDMKCPDAAATTGGSLVEALATAARCSCATGGAPRCERTAGCADAVPAASVHSRGRFVDKSPVVGVDPGQPADRGAAEGRRGRRQGTRAGSPARTESRGC